MTAEHRDGRVGGLPRANLPAPGGTPPAPLASPVGLKVAAGLGVLLLAPKCALCLLGYFAAGAGFFAAAQDICGSVEPVSRGSVGLAAAGVVTLLAVGGLAAWRRRNVRKDGDRS